MKTIDTANTYFVLVNAKLTKVSDVKSKCAIVKILSALRPVAENFEKDSKAIEKAAQGENHEEMMQKAQQFNDLSESEKVELNRYFIPYNKRKEELMKDFNEKETDLKFDKVSNEVVEQLIESNPDLTVGQIDILIRNIV